MQTDHESSDRNPTPTEGRPGYHAREIAVPSTIAITLRNTLVNYFRKMRATTISPPRVSLSEILWSWVGGFCGIGAVSFINFNLIEKTDLLMVIGSFGA
ncbi:MAG: hypothetical protein ACE10F_08455, partial [Candidatus Methylomirabilales bacterium]